MAKDSADGCAGCGGCEALDSGIRETGRWLKLQIVVKQLLDVLCEEFMAVSDGCRVSVDTASEIVPSLHNFSKFTLSVQYNETWQS